MSAEASQEVSTICERGLRRKPLIGIHRNDLGAARSRKAGTQAGARHWVLNINQINMNVSAGGNFE